MLRRPQHHTRGMNQQLLALLYAVLGGISMGIYPAFIKTPAVLE
eukprot:SAG31_NODE_22231_length_530_cov_17.058005_1_plen_43_part_10